MPTAAIDDVSLNYELHGTGAPVLMIMGLGVGLVGWLPQIEALAGEDWQLCVYDNRGVGRSSVPRPPYRMSRMAADALALMDHLGWQQAHVVGISMGGMIAQHVALTAPERVQSLALLATHAGGWGGRPTRTALTGLFGAHLSGSAAMRHRALVSMLYSQQFIDQMGMSEIDTGLKQSILHSPAPRRGMLGQVSAIVCHRTLRRLSALRELPVLVITGTGDAMVRPDNSQRLAAALDAELLTFEGSGHAIHVEQRVAVNAALQRHFSQAARMVE